ncbi:hypothetical protein GUJ93_ZPchr0001g29703 [Zizania palustris]|uniref:Uncharacterized protein n=1 Tax=Zizania palustris TaxID=103762 RepID=A0A8J5RS04_ZIZPA|nr:hypothetical protein GUJ93_ZPchr0001g29703 [Zizania palustris]
MTASLPSVPAGTYLRRISYGRHDAPGSDRNTAFGGDHDEAVMPASACAEGRSGSEVLRQLRTQASQEQKFEAKKTSLHLQPSEIYSAKSVQAPHTGCFEQASHFTLRKSGQPSEDFDQVLGGSNWCWASYTKVYTHTNGLR